MAYHVPACVVCGVDWHNDVKCFLCDERVCNESSRVFDGEYFCSTCWEKGKDIRPKIEEEDDKYQSAVGRLWDQWKATKPANAAEGK